MDNSPTLLSLANDVSYNDIFEEQLKNFINPGDLVIAISGSGNSENVLRAARFAKEKGNKVIDDSLNKISCIRSIKCMFIVVSQ